MENVSWRSRNVSTLTFTIFQLGSRGIQEFGLYLIDLKVDEDKKWKKCLLIIKIIQ